MSSLFGARTVSSSVGSSAPSSTELNLQNDRQLTSLPEDSISDLAFAPRADYLAVASWDKKVRIYEVSPQGDSQGRAMFEHQAPVLSAQWLPDGSKVFSGGCDNAVRLYDLQSSQTVQIGSHSAPVSSVRSVEVAGNVLIASASWDKTLKYWDMRQEQPVSTIQLPERAYSMDTKKNLLVVGTAERHICVIDLSNPGQIFKTSQTLLKWQIRVISCYPAGNGYAVGSIEGRCAIQYIDDGEQNKLGFSFKCHREQNNAPPRNESVIYPVNAISFHPQFGTFSTAGSDGTVHFWDKDSRCRLRYSRPQGGSISATAFSANGNLFAYAVSYDWSKGHQINTPQYPNLVKIHVTPDEEIKQRAKK